MDSVTSKDGTTIAFDRVGDGPPVILVSGGSVDRGSNAPVADVLATQYTVFNYDRRGRGPSGDTQPYAVQREIEDIDAVIGAAGGAAGLYGSSSGAALALEAAAAGLAVTKLALWEPPYIGEGRPRPADDTASIYRKFVAEGKRGDAVEYFMAKVVGMSPEFVGFARSQPWWPAQEALAHTLAYDAEIMGDYILPIDRVAKIAVPTLVSPEARASTGWTRPPTRSPMPCRTGSIGTIEGASHDVDAKVLGPLLAEFFAG